MRTSADFKSLLDSKPCINCYNMMKLFGVKNIIYSNEYSLITKIKLIELKTNVISKGMREQIKYVK